MSTQAVPSQSSASLLPPRTLKPRSSRRARQHAPPLPRPSLQVLHWSCSCHSPLRPGIVSLQADIAAAVARIATLVNEPPHDLVQDLRDALARQRPAGAAAVGPAPIPCSTGASARLSAILTNTAQIPARRPHQHSLPNPFLLAPADAASLASARARVLATEAALPALRARLDAASSKLTRVLSEVDAQRARPAPGSVERAVAGIMPRAEQSPAGLGLMSPAAGASGGDVAAHGAALRNPVLPF